MRKKSAGLLSLVVAAGLGTTTLGAPAVSATPAPTVKNVGTSADRPDDVAGHELPNPMEDKRRALRQEALTELLSGRGTVEKRGASTVMKVSTRRTPAAADKNGVVTEQATTQDQYVELSREKTDKIFVVLTDFGNERHPDFPDKDLEPSIEGPKSFEGPENNQIPAPDRAVDNSTVWQPNYDQKHFQDLYFGQGDEAGSGGATESVKQYFERQSSGRYSIDGTVTNWVKVRYNEARYGRSSDNPATNGDDPAVCSGHVCNNTWNLVQDAVNTWYADQIAKGRTAADVTAELKSFDQWDRYDVDNDGNFNEPDGYLDHFQIVHAGGDEADGDPNQGEDAIWSHRWYAFGTDYGRTGPTEGKQGGTQIGDTGVWVGDYTIQPENGGMSVFAHEYTHDLGLPDLYDTAGGENSVNYWSLMAQSREAAPNDQGIGTRASDLGAWDKLQLGWLNYALVKSGRSASLDLGPSEYNTKKPQAAVVELPQKQVTQKLATPYAGSKDWWSGTGDDYSASMTRTVDVPAGTSALTFQGQYNVEKDYDYAFVEVKDGAAEWKSIPGTGTDPTVNNGITGDTAGAWKPMSFDLSAYAGKQIQLRVRYQTDGGVQGNSAKYPAGLFLDDISIAGGPTDGAETSPNGWTLAGFSAVGDSVTEGYANYYIASHRDYVSFDKYLQSGPYNFGFLNTRPDWVEHFPYQDGLLVSYWDTSQSDNNTSSHPGEGLILPVDANPYPIVRVDGTVWRPRVAGYDAPFSLEKSDSFTLHVNGRASDITGQPAQPLFHDDASYWNAAQPTASVKVPNTGTSIQVLTQKGTSMGIKVGRR
ncbi:MAG TPA: immune inhibitor A domain-containing protein [Nocardioidaceae bacterium]|nr:immune inhibitor A domain-containing protein [Nocardioidaceae bacterium]